MEKSFNKNIFFSQKKGISSVIATSLLIILVVVSVISFQNWYNQFNSNIY